MKFITQVTAINPGASTEAPINILTYRLYRGKLTELIAFQTIFGGQINELKLGETKVPYLILNKQIITL